MSRLAAAETVDMRISASWLMMLLLAGCMGMPARTDTLCGELRKFGDSRESADGTAVILTISRELQIRDDPSAPGNLDLVFAEVNCKHDETAGGRRLCAYLLDHTITESPQHNFLRAARCMGKADPGQKPDGTFARIQSTWIENRRMRHPLRITYSAPTAQHAATLSFSRP